MTRWLALAVLVLASPAQAGGPGGMTHPGPADSRSDESRTLAETPQLPDSVAGFLLRADEVIIPYTVFGLYVEPGQQVELDTVLSGEERQYELLAEAGEAETLAPQRWRWTAPKEPGLVTLVVSEPSVRREIRLNVFVTRPLSEMEGQHLRGYQIGAYPAPRNDKPRYQPPAGLVEVTEDNREALVSPHFRVGQFLTKQGGGWPRYVALDERLLLKLEMILDKVREKGIAAETLFIMSGYRTPYYNRRIGNVPNSRHVFGDASDIFVDVDGDGRMDDLDGDGRSDFEDARVLADWISELADDPFYAPLVGGLGRYGPKPHRGPFVHVDTRGYPARWDAP